MASSQSNAYLTEAIQYDPLFLSPKGIHIDRRGNVWATYLYTSNIKYITLNGSVKHFQTDPIPQSLFSIVFDETNDCFYATVIYSNIVIKIFPNNGNWLVWAGSGQEKSEEGVGTNASFHHPAFLTLDSAGNLYVDEEGGWKIAVISPNREVKHFSNLSSLPAGIAISKNNSIILADRGNRVIKRISQSGNQVDILAGSPTGTLRDVDGVGTNARFHDIYGLAIDSKQNIYIGEMIEFTLRKLSPRGEVISVRAYKSAEDQTQTPIQIPYLSGIAVDADDNLYLTSAHNNIVYKLTFCSENTEFGSKCLCKEGYTMSPDKICELCPLGKYKPSSGNQDCWDCPENTISNTMRNLCIPIQRNQSYASSQSIMRTSTVIDSIVKSSASASISHIITMKQTVSTPLIYFTKAFPQSSSSISVKPTLTEESISDGKKRSIKGSSGNNNNNNIIEAASLISLSTTDLELLSLVGSIILILLVCICVCIYQRLNRTRSISRNINNTDDSNSTSTTVLYSEKTESKTTKITYPTFAGSSQITLHATSGMAIPGFLQYQYENNFIEQKVLAIGGFGTVRLATTDNTDLKKYGKLVVIKKSRDFSRSSDIRDSFYQEISIMYMLRGYKNIVKFLGYTEFPFAMILKYYPLGSLRQFMKNQNHTKTRNLQIQFLLDISRGVRALVTHGIAHCDLKCDNILIDLVNLNAGHEKGRLVYCVLSDFGVSTFFNAGSLNISGFRVAKLKGLSLAYSSPEALRWHKLRRSISAMMKEDFDLKRSDVYSLAFIIFEVMNRKTAW